MSATTGKRLSAGDETVGQMKRVCLDTPRACYICQDEGAAAPTPTGCACRGGADMCHSHCLAEFNKAHQERCELDPLQSYFLWAKCRICKQDYSGRMHVDLARHWVQHCDDLALPQDDPHRLFARFFEANGKVETTQFAEAEKMYRDILSKMDNNPSVTMDQRTQVRCHFAHLLHIQDKSGEALHIYQELYDLMVRIEGPDCDNALTIMQNMAAIDLARGHVQQAAEKFRSVIDQKSQEKSKHEFLPVKFQISKLHLASCMCELFRWPEAVAISKEVIEATTKNLGPSHKITLTAKKTLARAYFELNDIQRAHDIILPVTQESARVLEPAGYNLHHLHHLQILAVCLWRLGKSEDAYQVQKDLYKRLEHVKDADADFVQTTRDLCVFMSQHVQQKCKAPTELKVPPPMFL